MLVVSDLNYKNILKNCSFSAQKGELIAIIGPNGAGKSTLLKLISREIKSKLGSIFWKKKDLYAYKSKELAKERVFMRQAYSLGLHFDLEEIVGMGRYPYFDRYPSLYDKEIIRISIKKMKLESLKNKKAKNLSGGEIQRMHFARALCQLAGENTNSSSKLFLLDEPLNNLDIFYQHLCMSNIKKATQNGNVTLVILHDLNIASLYADKIMLIKKGELLSFKPTKEILKKNLLEDCFSCKVTILNHPIKKRPFICFG